MGPWLVLVSPCFRENVVATCKIGSFLCSLDNLLQKNVIVFVFGNQVSKWRSFEKRAIFDLLFTFSCYKNSFNTHLKHIHTRFLLTLLTLLPYQFWKKYEFIRYGCSLVFVLVLILIRAILEQSIIVVYSYSFYYIYPGMPESANRCSYSGPCFYNILQVYKMKLIK